MTDRPTGLPMVSPPDPEKLAADKRWLTELESAGVWTRTFAYMRRGGPGYLQAALTLGGGSAAFSLFAGAAFGYQLLWVAPVSMLFGVIMLAAVAHQTLSTGMRPFEAMRTYAGPVFAWGWAIGAVLSSLIWHFAQYALASAVLEDIGTYLGLGLSRGVAGIGVLGFALVFVFMYGASSVWMKAFETLLKTMVWLIVACFGLVVAKTGVANVGDLFRGLFTFQIPGEVNGVHASTLVISGLAAAVGVNMLFLYPYSLLAKGWGREHRRLAKFDLLAGMFVPYLFATGLMIIATANGFYYGDLEFTGDKLAAVEAARSLEGVIGPGLSRVVFNLGILGMAWSSITLQMLCCGFAATELLGWQIGSAKYRLACLLPAPGVLGAFFWGDIAFWIAVPTTILCGCLLPLAYFGFCRLQRSREYLGDDVPRGSKATAWLGAMVLITLFLSVVFGWIVITQGPGYLDKLAG